MIKRQLACSLKLFTLTIIGFCLFSSVSIAQTCSYTGTWNTNYGQMKLTQHGPEVTGTYGSNGKIAGSVRGYELTAVWWKGSSYNPEKSGEVNFYISPNCKSLTGDWRMGTASDGKQWNYSSWKGTKVYYKPRPPSSPPPRSQPKYIQNSGGYGLPTY